MISYAQETHIKQGEKWFLKYFIFTGFVYHAPVAVKKRGVMIGISKRLPWLKSEIILDTDGQMLIVQDKMWGMTWNFVGVHAPQTKQNDFYHDLIK